MKRVLIERQQKSLLECDTPGCNTFVSWSEEGERNMKEHIGLPCPKCGGNLLTEEDFKDYINLLRTVKWLNRYFSWTMYLVSKKRYNARKSVSVKVHEGIHIKEDKQ